MKEFEGYENESYGREFMDFVNRCEDIQAREIPKWLIEHLDLRSVIDIGCASGIYLVPFYDNECEVHGVDASTEAGEFLTAWDFERADLRLPYFPIDGAYDLCICFEVLEHIPAEFEDVILDSLARCSDTIVFTWAVPGQGGTHHHNERPHSYALAKFAERGYEIHELNGKMHEFLEGFRPQEREGTVSGWILNNSFLLKRVR